MDLPLEGRAGLPDTLAYLRASYPRDGWQGHANYGQLAAFWLHVHATLRTEGGHVAALVDELRADRIDEAVFRRAFVARLNGFLQHLNGHHQIEDHAYFPKFRVLDPRMVAGFDLLEADHELIHDALAGSARSAQVLMNALGGDRDASRRAADAYAADGARLLALLRQHLADEEELVMPAMLHHGERSVS